MNIINTLGTLDFTIRLFAAIVFGFIIGLERQIRGHYTGVRTNVLVCLGSCMFVLFPMIIGSEEVVRSAAQVITGVGFLGSGIIFKDGTNIRGINTAATIWCTAAIGMITSSGKITFAAIATLILILSNVGLRILVSNVDPRFGLDEDGEIYMISITCKEETEFLLRAMIMDAAKKSTFILLELESEDLMGEKVEISAKFLSEKRRDDIAEDLIARISLEEGVVNVGWKIVG